MSSDVRLGARRRQRRFVVVSVVGATLVASCAFGPQTTELVEDDAVVPVFVIDEDGHPVPGASLTVGDRIYIADDDGRVPVELGRSEVAIADAEGMLAAPVALDPRGGPQNVRLWARTGRDGEQRITMHFGGDVMLGRRYLESSRPGTPVVTDAASARAVVDDVAPITATADLTVVNLESVIGDFDDGDALEAKRFLLQSTPYVVDALDEMGVDLVTLGNNHSYDYGDTGLEHTLDVLADAGIPQVGAGMSREEAVRGVVLDVGDTRIGMLSFTTVNGNYVNDRLPTSDDITPADLDPAERWQYDRRPFEYGRPDDAEYIPRDLYRIGDVWRIFSDLEDVLDPERVAPFWSAIRDVFPELQDWVARRGHGGAAPYRRSEMVDEIARLERSGADFVVVQVHGGFQFADVKSSFMQRIAHAAVEAGADAVIGHHPHVLQGVEYHDGALIAYSLGNLLFDQDFLSTFPSAVLRMVVAGDEILEARFLPVTLDRYRPVPVTGSAAIEILRTISSRSSLGEVSARGPDLGVRIESVAEPSGDEARIQLRGNSGVVVDDLRPEVDVVELDDDRPAPLPACALVRTDTLDQRTEVAVDLFGWGDFDDRTADGGRGRPAHWALPTDPDEWSWTEGASGDEFDDAVELYSDVNRGVTIRFLARVPLVRHRLVDESGAPVDAGATYEVVLDARRSRGERPVLRVATFDFDDTDPTVDPQTERLHDVEIELDVPDDGDWHRVSAPLPPEIFEPGDAGHVPNSAILVIETPPALNGSLAIDSVAFLEWRGASRGDVERWVPADAVRRAGGGTIGLDVLGC